MPTSAPEAAAGSKEETVYVLTDAAGEAQKIIVSDKLTNAEGADSLNDRSELQNIENVNGDETYQTGSDNQLIWNAQGRNICYQGTTDKELPIALTVRYRLDGKDISPEELAGKSGKVTIRFDYTNRQYETVEIDGKQEKVYVPFAVLTGMLLDNEGQTWNGTGLTPDVDAARSTTGTARSFLASHSRACRRRWRWTARSWKFRISSRSQPMRRIFRWA